MKEILARIRPARKLYMGEQEVKPEFTRLQKPARATITGVDGGSAILLHTSAYCVAFVRIVAATLEPRSIEKKEGFLLAQAHDDKVQVLFEDRELFVENVELDKAVDLGRKMLEWELADKAQGTVVWDGAYDTKFAFEKPPHALALAKSSSALGSYKVFEDAPNTPWIARSGNYQFVKLHEKGKIFRVDGKGDFSTLVPWAQDPVFVGYPYPLILADQLARVSNDERMALRVRLKVEAGRRWEELAQGEQNAHDILDNMQY